MNEAGCPIFSQILNFSLIEIFSNQKMLTLKKMQKPHIWGGHCLSIFQFLNSFARNQSKTVCHQPSQRVKFFSVGVPVDINRDTK